MKRSFKKAVLSLFLLAASCLIVSCRAEKKVLTAPEDMKAIEAPGMTIGVASGYIFDDVLVRAFPNADIRFYDSREEAYSALSCGEVNGVADDEGLIRARMRSDESIELLEGYVEPSDYALIFPKDEEGEKLRDAFNAYLSEAAADGTLEKLDRKWFGKETDNKQSEDVEALSAERGTLRMAFENPTIPFVYLSAGKPVGYEMDLIIGFCKENGYGLEAEAVDFVDVLTGVASSDYDLGASAITVTERRKEDLYFSDPDYVGGICICVNSEAERVSTHNGLGELKNDFFEAFVEGQRGKRLVSGFLLTAAMILLVALTGSLLGAVWFILSKRGLWLIRSLIKWMLRIIRLTPPVVMILALYYAYYMDFALGAFLASVIGFSLSFSEGVYRILSRHAAACPKLETDFRLEAIDSDTFFVRLLRCKAEELEYEFELKIEELIKESAVVGYLALSDLAYSFRMIYEESTELWLPLIATGFGYMLLGVCCIRICRLRRKRRLERGIPDGAVPETEMDENGEKLPK